MSFTHGFHSLRNAGTSSQSLSRDILAHLLFLHSSLTPPMLTSTCLDTVGRWSCHRVGSVAEVWTKDLPHYLDLSPWVWLKPLDGEPEVTAAHILYSQPTPQVAVGPVIYMREYLTLKLGWEGRSPHRPSENPRTNYLGPWYFLATALRKKLPPIPSRSWGWCSFIQPWALHSAF